MRTVLETEYGIDDIFDALLNLFGSSLVNRYEDAEHAKQEHAIHLYPFLIVEQNRGTCVLYREIPLPWYGVWSAF